MSHFSSWGRLAFPEPHTCHAIRCETWFIFRQKTLSLPDSHGKKILFPWVQRLQTEASTTRIQSIERAFLLSALVNTQLSKPFTVTEIHHSKKHIQNTFSWGLYLADQPGTMIRTWLHAHMQSQKCVTFPAVTSHLSSPGPASNVSPGMWRFWVSHSCHRITDS